jgi:hypothetical protein
MSSAAATKLSPTLKALINAPHARGAAIPTSPRLSSLFKRIEDDARSKDIGMRTWLCLSTASLVTMNSPAAVCDLYSYATRSMAKAEDKAMAAAVSSTWWARRGSNLKCCAPWRSGDERDRLEMYQLFRCKPILQRPFERLVHNRLMPVVYRVKYQIPRVGSDFQTNSRTRSD